MTKTGFIHDYVDRATSDDLDAYLALFATDAVVEDEGPTHRGGDAIRSWRSAITPVHYEVTDTMSTAVSTTARVAISVGFPGSPVTLIFAFALDDNGLIESLSIRPEVTS